MCNGINAGEEFGVRERRPSLRGLEREAYMGVSPCYLYRKELTKIYQVFIK